MPICEINKFFIQIGLLSNQWAVINLLYVKINLEKLKFYTSQKLSKMLMRINWAMLYVHSKKSVPHHIPAH